jgi:hypothetical protein
VFLEVNKLNLGLGSGQFIISGFPTILQRDSWSRIDFDQRFFLYYDAS